MFIRVLFHCWSEMVKKRPIFTLSPFLLCIFEMLELQSRSSRGSQFAIWKSTMQDNLLQKQAWASVKPLLCSRLLWIACPVLKSTNCPDFGKMAALRDVLGLQWKTMWKKQQLGTYTSAELALAFSSPFDSVPTLALAVPFAWSTHPPGIF